MSKTLQATIGGNGTAVPEVMKHYRQFVVWKLVQKPSKAKPDKVPFDPTTGRPAAVNAPASWSNYAAAKAAFERGGYDGIGFVFTPDDPLGIIDLDGCLDPATKQWKPHVQRYVNFLPGAWETSQSGFGLHGIGIVGEKSRLINKRSRFTDGDGNPVEFYVVRRFVAFGKTDWVGEIGPDWTNDLAGWLPDDEKESDFPSVEWVDEPRLDYDGPTDDDELIRRALASPQRNRDKPSFAMLWNADDELGQFYPDEGGQSRAFDHSRALLALMNGLAWWTGCNPARMERLYSQSPLARGY